MTNQASKPAPTAETKAAAPAANTAGPGATPTPATPAAEPKKPGRGGGPPQQHGRRRRQKSRYGTQMEEKQNLKGIYNVREKQLRNYYAEASRSKLETGPELITLLERRLDNALFRSGFSETRRAARQLASHRLVEVNGQPVTIPSIRLRSGDKISIRENKQGKPLFSNFEKRMQNVVPPSWITLNPGAFSFTVTGLPDPEEAGVGIDVRAIVEYFAR